MRFEALELSLDVIVSLRPLVQTMRRRDVKNTNHIRDAASSICRNLGEGNRRQGADRLYLWNVASGSAEEVRLGLRVALAWGYLPEKATEKALEQIDRLQAMLWKLTH